MAGGEFKRRSRGKRPGGVVKDVEGRVEFLWFVVLLVVAAVVDGRMS